MISLTGIMVLLWSLLLFVCERRMSHTPSQLTTAGLVSIANFVRDRSPGSLPGKNIEEFEAWLDKQLTTVSDSAELERCLQLVRRGPAGRLELVDLWGRRLHASASLGHEPTLLLYSLGPNGKDEGGSGDNISVTITFKPATSERASQGAHNDDVSTSRGAVESSTPTATPRGTCP